MIVFTYPYLWLLLLLPLVVYYLLPPVKGIYGDALKVPFVKDFARIESAGVSALASERANDNIIHRFWSLFLVWIFLTLAAMRPVLIGEPMRLPNKGRDILLITDISTSMLENDYRYQGRKLSRINAVKAVVSDFIEKRKSDRIGLVLFGTRAYLQTPLTYDHHSVKEVLLAMEPGMAGNSTSIGDALGLAVKSMKNETLDSVNNKIIILLTDGENNDGKIGLPEAISLAANEGIKVYTVGVGGEQNFLNSLFIKSSNLDERSLQKLAAETKGQYFRADDLQTLTHIYREIDKLEPAAFEQSFIYPRKELYYLPLLVAILIAVYLAYRFRSLRA